MAISLAYSPDTDDAFMVEAMRAGAIDLEGLTFTFTAADIQQLNEAALQGTYDVTAISVGAYPWIARDYELMTVGASVADGPGPAVVVSHPQATALTWLEGRRVATPGAMTTAHLAAKLLLPPCTLVAMPFDTIDTAVGDGDVDAGILIHERQLPEAQGKLTQIGDLGLLWSQRYGTPLPLGANAVHRRLADQVRLALARVYRRSIEFGLAHREPTLRAALERSGAPLAMAEGDAYIRRYVNHDSVTLRSEVRSAIDELYAHAAANGLCPELQEPLWETKSSIE